MRTRLALLSIVLAAIAGYALHALAQPRFDTRPVMLPVPSASSNGVSFAWFYDSGTRAVVLCRAGSGANDPMDCKTHTTLP
jgi:hypothetical protein